MSQLICSVYRSPKKEGMYLYVEKSKGLSDVPEALLAQFGNAEHAMTLLLTPDRKLARADVEKVMAQVRSNGFYLQMPPVVENERRAITERNSKLSTP